MKFYAALLLLFASACTALASFPVGYTTPAGYVLGADGFWWHSGQAYTRSQAWQPGYGYGCNYVAGYYYWKYAPVQVVTKYVNNVSPSDPGWRGKLLDLAAARDRVEGEVRKGAFEQQYFLEAVNALGLQGNFRLQAYGTAPAYLALQHQQYANQYQLSGHVTNFGANATTQYGYSYNSIKQLYGDADLATIFQQAAQLTAQSQKLSGDATSGFQGLVSQEGNNRARVAEIIAKGQMAQQIVAALQAGPASEVKGFSFKVTPAGIQRSEDGVTAEAKTSLLEKWKALATERCSACHNAEVKKGNFDIAVYPSLTPDIKQKIWSVLTTPDDKTVMPRAQDGGPGKRLTPEELRLFFLN